MTRSSIRDVAAETGCLLQPSLMSLNEKSNVGAKATIILEAIARLVATARLQISLCILRFARVGGHIVDRKRLSSRRLYRRRTSCSQTWVAGAAM